MIRQRGAKITEKPFYKTPVGLLLLGATIGELMPDLSDLIHFFLFNGYIYQHPELFSKGWFTALQIFDWYLLTALFFFFIFLIAWFLHVRKVSQIKLALGIGAFLSVSAVVVILVKSFIGG